MLSVRDDEPVDSLLEYVLVLLLTDNESVYLPLGVTHSLENPGKIPLEIIEVQTGSYLGEDDIVRLEELYGRVEEAVCK